MVLFIVIKDLVEIRVIQSNKIIIITITTIVRLRQTCEVAIEFTFVVDKKEALN